ncbi:hypothetical protein HX088_11300 [Empedobacter sp. 225-1]|uniref:hypothetical protein n=1 Tax=Empedobacter sp. 225-1 TaxID=2746725 RepID=UPI0025765B13|nr:hypothetical protein [Empedobacter sp. 225-1]MDM1523852.1 hypothetical protein [Empedobacter sp. 225-1]
MEIVTTYSTESTQLFECFNKINNTFIVRFDETKIDNGYKYQQFLVVGDKAIETIKTTINNYYNEKCSDEILKGFKLDSDIVWLSSENQINYKIYYDFALFNHQNDLEFKPIKIKIGDETNTKYHTFESFNDFQKFVFDYTEHIQNTISKYWDLKDSIEWEKYTQ